VNELLKVQPIGESRGRIDPRDVAYKPAYEPWIEAAKLYGRALNALPAGASRDSTIDGEGVRVLTVRMDRADPSRLQDSMRIAYRDLRPGDMLVVDVPSPTFDNGDVARRERVSQALFKTGFDHPLIWAGRKVLEAENRFSVANFFLSSGALGAGPAKIPGLVALLEVEPGQTIAIARRGMLAPPAERTMQLSVVMPVYNEKATFHEVIEGLLAKAISGFEIEVCIVESNSTDGTRDEVLRYKNHPRIRLLLEEKPSGKGHAVRNGLRIASGDIILIQDADLEYDLDDYEKLVRPIVLNQAAFVLGSRHPAGKGAWQLRQFADQRGVADLMNIGHLFFTWFFNLIFRQALRDPFTMFKVFRRDCINNLRFECNRFDFDQELVAKLIRNGFTPIEIDVHYQSRSFRQGKKVSFFRDPPTWITACVKHRFSNLHVWPASV
jgi:hypothetical protein